MKGSLAFKDELIGVVKELPKNMIKEVVDFAKYLQWQNISKRTFAERVDDLWIKMRGQAEKSGFKLDDVSKFIAASRKKN